MLSVLTLAACATPQPQVQNPFLGTWANADNDAITIRADTVVVHQPNGQSTALGSAVCGGVFDFAYATWSSQMLTASTAGRSGAGVTTGSG